MEINFKKLDKNATIPKKMKKGDVGLDLTAVSNKIINENEFGYIEYDTGIAVEIPEGYGGFIFPRSSISNTGMWLANSVGVIDNNYRGSIKCRFKAIPNTKIYKVGERIAQLIIMPIMHVNFNEVNNLSKTERNEKGFGSSN